MQTKPIKICAPYTRKSREEGLEQEFNSLDAQDEAARSFILSHKHEGWRATEKTYSDGGISGGTIERPGLQELLADVRAGKIDIIVFYKVDRFTRSLFDFADIMRELEKHGVSIVSVTEPLNTTTAAGNLFMNMLLSFAQFEREIAGERVRDKCAASKKKGKWMGGTPPLGYDSIESKLHINRKEANLVKHIFARFNELGSTTTLIKELNDAGYTTKSWTSKKGKYHPGRSFAKSSIYRILRNVVYVGKIKHKDEAIYEGEHRAIITHDVWKKTQDIMDGNIRISTRIGTANSPALLRGLLFDPEGRALTPTHTRKKDKLYHYYVSTKAIKVGYENCKLKTIAASEIDSIIMDHVKVILTQPGFVVKTYKEASKIYKSIKQSTVQKTFANFDELWAELFPTMQARVIELLIKRITIHPDHMVMQLHNNGIYSLMAELDPTLEEQKGKKLPKNSDVDLKITIPIALKRHGGRKYIVSPDGSNVEMQNNAPNYDRTLIKALVHAFDWQEQLDTGKVRTIEELAAQDDTASDLYIRQVIRLANLAPDIVESILNGRQPKAIDLTTMRKSMPMAWEEQRKLFGFQAAA